MPTHKTRISKGRRPSDPLLLDDRRQTKAEPTGRPNRERYESVIAVLSSPQPPAEHAAKPAIDAYTLLKSWRLARMNGDRANAAALLAELERLATRPTPRAEGNRDERHG